MVSYELSVGLSILTMVAFAGTMDVVKIVEAQADHWFIFSAHIPAIIAFVIYMIAGTAETNRGPFDLPEASLPQVITRNIRVSISDSSILRNTSTCLSLQVWPP